MGSLLFAALPLLCQDFLSPTFPPWKERKEEWVSGLEAYVHIQLKAIQVPPHWGGCGGGWWVVPTKNRILVFVPLKALGGPHINHGSKQGPSFLGDLPRGFRSLAPI